MKRVALALIRLYQRYISPGKPSCCRFSPTCSHYAYEAVERWGVVLGVYLALWRLFRCNPLFRAGADPVPPRIHTKQKR